MKHRQMAALYRSLVDKGLVEQTLVLVVFSWGEFSCAPLTEVCFLELYIMQKHEAVGPACLQPIVKMCWCFVELARLYYKPESGLSMLCTVPDAASPSEANGDSTLRGRLG